jgi:hypothetical protein
MRVDADLRPIDSYVSLWKDGEHKGTGYYWKEGQYLHSVLTAPNGTLRQSAEVPREFSIATRPQAAFGWHLWYYDFTKRGIQPTTVYVIEKWGLGVGSILADVQKLEAELLGEERISVGAGDFDAWRFRIGPIYELWIDKADFNFIKLVVAKKNCVYELVELHEGDH